MSDLRENLDKQIAQLRQAIAESHQREELQKESAAELRRSLEEAQARISSLENQINLAQQNEKPAVSRKQARRGERQGRNRARRDFFGGFGTPQRL
jgi:chromosome segregation ATPase